MTHILVILAIVTRTLALTKWYNIFVKGCHCWTHYLGISDYSCVFENTNMKHHHPGRWVPLVAVFRALVVGTRRVVVRFLNSSTFVFLFSQVWTILNCQNTCDTDWFSTSGNKWSWRWLHLSPWLGGTRLQSKGWVDRGNVRHAKHAWWLFGSMIRIGLFFLTDSSKALVSGIWTETKKCITVDFFWTWHMIMCRLRIQKIKIGN